MGWETPDLNIKMRLMFTFVFTHFRPGTHYTHTLTRALALILYYITFITRPDAPSEIQIKPVMEVEVSFE